MKLKTDTTVRAMSKDNPFSILDTDLFDEVVITTSAKVEGKNHKVQMSFARPKAVPMNHSDVVAAIKKCVDSTKEQMLTFIHRTEKPIDNSAKKA